MRRPARLLSVALVAALAADVLIARLLLADGTFLGRRIAPYDPPLFTASQLDRLEQLEERLQRDPEAFRLTTELDPELGWCPRPGTQRGLLRYDRRGARVPPGPPSAEAPRPLELALVGCSYTRGDEVPAEETWAARVADESGRETANFGVGGHGLGQMLLRYRRDVRPLEPAEVWLGFLPAALLRVTTHFPPLFNHWSGQLAFKPRFVLSGSAEPELVRHPAPDPARAFRLLRDQEAFLEAIGATDFWIRRAPWAFAPRDTPWAWSASARLVATWREGRDHASFPWFGRPASEPYRLARTLLERFASEVSSDGARFRLLILPSRGGLWSARDAAPWEAFAGELRGAGIELLDLTPAFLAADLHERDDGWMPNGHYAPAAHAVVVDALREAGWLDRP